MKSRSLFVAAIVVFATTVLPRISAAESPTLIGEYTFDAAISNDINAAIEDAVGKMNFIKRPIARGRLKKTNPAYQRIAIARNPGEIVVTLDARKPIQMPDSGNTIKWTREDGEKFDLTAAWKDTQLTQTYVAEDGKRVNDFTLAEDGNTMTLQVTLTSDQLAKPLTYTLGYRRAATQ
jgi:hypothetical protein